MTWREQYQSAYHDFQRREYPGNYKNFGYLKINYPDVTKANGLNKAIRMFLFWQGAEIERHNTTGMKIFDKKKNKEIWIPSSGGRGHADVSGTFRGKSVHFETKIGRDKPSDHQLKRQEGVRRNGGIYEFIHTIEEFFQWYQMNVEIWK